MTGGIFGGVTLTDDENRAIWEKIFPTKEKAHNNVVQVLQSAHHYAKIAKLLCNKAELGQDAQDEIQDIMARIEKALLPL